MTGRRRRRELPPCRLRKKMYVAAFAPILFLCLLAMLWGFNVTVSETVGGFGNAADVVSLLLPVFFALGLVAIPIGITLAMYYQRRRTNRRSPPMMSDLVKEALQLFRTRSKSGVGGPSPWVSFGSTPRCLGNHSCCSFLLSIWYIHSSRCQRQSMGLAEQQMAKRRRV